MLAIIQCRIFFFQYAVQKYVELKLAFCMGVKLCSPTLSKEHSLRVFRNRVLRKVFGPERDKVTGELGRQHYEILYDLYSPNIWVIKSRRMRWVGHVAHMGKRRGAYRIVVGRLEGEKPLRRPRHTW
jgi:hypothetical protein